MVMSLLEWLSHWCTDPLYIHGSLFLSIPAPRDLGTYRNHIRWQTLFYGNGLLGTLGSNLDCVDYSLQV